MFSSEIFQIIFFLTIPFFFLVILIYKRNPLVKLQINKLAGHPLFRHNSDAVFILDWNGNIIKANHSVEMIFGYKPNELIRKPFSTLIEASSLVTTAIQLDDTLLGLPSIRNVHGHHKNGNKLALILKFVPFAEKKQTYWAMVIVTDNTNIEQIKTSLHETNEQLTSFLNNTIDAINITNIYGELIYTNHAFEKMFGWSKGELQGKPLPIIPDYLIEDEERNRITLLSGRPVVNWDRQLLRKDGSLIYVNVSISPLKDTNGMVVAFAAITRDETERKEVEKKLKEKEERFRIIAENSSDLIRVIDNKGIIKYASPSHYTLLGYHPDKDMDEEYFYKNIHPEDSERVIKLFNEMIAHPQNTIMSYRKMHKNGHYIDIEANCSPFFDENKQLSHYIVVSRDISERKQYEKQLKEIAYLDPLTGVANRRLFYKWIMETIDKAKKNNDIFALLYLDFDRFKWVNDSMGHDVGDELLYQFVGRIKDVLGYKGSISRLGGDEFAVLLTDVSSKEDIAENANKINQILQKPWHIKDQHFITTSSIGISVFPFHGQDTRTLINNADHALYQAKEKGRNLYQFYSSNLKRKKDRLLLLENDLKSAIKNQHLYLVYQPQINLLTGSTECLEVLLRYNHPKLGLVPPDEFIPICEKTGLINDITLWIIDEVALQYQSWKERGFTPVKFAINISPSSLQNEHNANRLRDAIFQANMPLNLLELEVTEYAFLENLEETKQKLTELKDMFVSVSLDDFGSGYSSLIYFKNLPFDKIKIDKNFIQGIYLADGKKDRAIIKSVISLAKELNIEIVCEGVETEEQFNFLLKHNLHLAQGFYFSKPLRSKELEQQDFLSLNRSNKK